MTITDLTCPIVKVSNAGAEDGLYEVIEDIRVKWAEERQVYKKSDSDRYGENIFNPHWIYITIFLVYRYMFFGKGEGDGWSIGPKQGLETGESYHNSKHHKKIDY